MRPESEARAVELFNEAVERPGPERARFLAEACGADVALRGRIDSLLAALSPAEGLPSLATVDQPVPAQGEQAGAVMGRYKLLQRIGEGGFGVVYMAEQQRPVRRRVALKIVKLGMDTGQVIARFEAERQALAMMDHPNIARVLDAGATDTGRPYFVMELVKGVPITDYCDQNHLTVPRRLELFVQVCRAVQHAHQKGIIHRDLKPSNVLVTLHDGVPVPKVIDFGIAKATESRLTEKTLFTDFHQMIGTPAYMSPEQAEMSGLDVDTRSDVYALGVLLYELLTGTTPFDPRELREKAYGEIQRIIREVEPPRPSTRLSTLGDTLGAVAAHHGTDAARLGRAVRGELDWIVMKCLEKDRTRRYETANGLAMDIGRYLNDEPVQARPTSAGYRLGKFARKHKTGAMALAAIMAALALGAAAATWGMLRARDGRSRAVASAAAEAEQRKAAESARRQVGEANTVLRDLLSFYHSDVDRLRRALAAADAKLAAGWLADQPETRAAIHSVIGQVYANLENYADADRHLRVALELNRTIHGPRHPDVGRLLQLLAQVAQARKDYPAAESLLAEAAVIGRSVQNEAPGVLSEALGDLYRLRQKQEDGEGANRALFEALQANLPVLARSLNDAPRSAETLRYAAQQSVRVGQFQLAAGYYGRLLELEPDEHWAWVRLVLLRAYLGDADGYRQDRQKMLDRFAETGDAAVAERTVKAWTLFPLAEGEQHRPADMIDRVTGPALTDNMLAPWWRITKGMTEYRAGRLDRAVGYLEEGARSVNDEQGKANAEAFLAMACRGLGRDDEARTALGRALHRIDQGPRPGTEDLEGGFQDWLISHTTIREAQHLIGAVDVEAEWLKYLRGEVEAKAKQIELKPDDTVLLAERGDLLTRLSRFPEAEADFGRAVRLEPARDRGRLYAAAILELYLGDHSGYREQRRRAVEHFGNTTDQWVAETAAKIILLAPCEGEALRDAGGLIDRGLAARKGKYVPGFFRATKGMAEYRAGRYAEAVRWLADGRDAWDAAGGKVMAESYLAMAYQRAGNPAEASAALARSRARMDAELPRAGQRDLLARKSLPFDWVTAQIAFREATALIDSPGAETRPAALK